MNLRRTIIVILLAISTNHIYSQHIKNIISITPSIGVMGDAFPGSSNGDISSDIAIGGPALAVKTQMRVYNNLWLGLRVGAVTSYPYDYIFPLFAGTLEYTFSKNFSLGLELPLLPTVTGTFGPHHISIGILPFYMISGGSTVFTIMYGYRFLL